MTGKELNRKYHELCGWKKSRQFMNEYRTETHDFWHTPDCNESTAHTVHFGINAMDGSGCRSHLPRLDRDANLAIAEADKVFANCWDSSRRAGQVFVSTARFVGTFYADGDHAFCEAILKALIAAGGK